VDVGAVDLDAVDQAELDEVDEVSSSMVFTPPWTPDKMSEDAKFALGF